MDFDVGITLVVLEADVVFGAVLFDEVHLKDERLQFGPDHDPLDIGDLAHETPRLSIVIRIGMKIRTDAVFQADGFAYVDDLPLGAFHQVTAGFCREGGKDALEFFGNFH